MPAVTKHYRGDVRHKYSQTMYQSSLILVRLCVRAVLLSIFRHVVADMFKPWALRVVFWMVLQRAAAEVACIAIIRGGLRGTCTNQTTITVKRLEGFCVHSMVPYRQTTRRRQPSRYGQHGQGVNGGLVKCYQKEVK